MAIIEGRLVWFYEDGVLMHGIVMSRSSLGRLTIWVYDNATGGTKQYYVEPEQIVYFSEESAVAHPPYSR